MRLRGVIVLVMALVGALLTARLGLWQLDRAAQKTALHDAMQRQRALPDLPWQQLARAASELPMQVHRSVLLRGRWLPEHTVFLENRQMNGRPGFYVVTPLQLDDRSVVLVQRGWVARDLLDRTRVAVAPPPVGELQLRGRIAPGPSRLYEFETAASGVIRQNLELGAYARETGLPLRPLTVVQQDEAGPAADGLLRQWPEPATGVDKHHGYAFQWFALSALIIGLYVWFQLIRPHRQRSARA